jgi:ACR3 family arsenite efflux pump ArsB
VRTSTVELQFGFQSQAITHQPRVITMLGVPILIQEMLWLSWAAR